VEIGSDERTVVQFRLSSTKILPILPTAVIAHVRTMATRVARFVVFVSSCQTHRCALQKRMDRYSCRSGADWCGWRARWRHLTNTTERSVRDAASCQIASTTCCCCRTYSTHKAHLSLSLSCSQEELYRSVLRDFVVRAKEF